MRRKLGASPLILVAHAHFAKAVIAEHPLSLEAVDAIAFEALAKPTIWNLTPDRDA